MAIEKYIAYCRSCNVFYILEENTEDKNVLYGYGYGYAKCAEEGVLIGKHRSSHVVKFEPESLYKNDLFFEYSYKKNCIYNESEKAYFNKLSDFTCVKEEIQKGFDTNEMKKILKKHKGSINKNTIKDLNKLELKQIILNTYVIEVNLLEKNKKDKFKFYINGELQKGWKRNVKTHFTNSIYHHGMKNSIFDNILKEEEIKSLQNLFGYNFGNMICMLANCPFLEILHNAGFFRNPTFYDYQKPYNNIETYNINGKSPHEILKVSKSCTSFLKDVSNGVYKNLKFHESVVGLQRYKDFDKNFFVSIINKLDKALEESNDSNISRGGIYFSDYMKIYQLAKNKSYNLDKLINYLINDLKEFQGFYLVSTALQELSDYCMISEALEMKYDKYPKSLKLEHDKVTYIKLLKADEFNKKLFAEAYEFNKKFDWKYKDYIIISPKEPLDLKKEGNNLSHCVGTYIDRYCNQLSRIFFLRKKSNPDKSLATIEVNENFAIVQAHGLANRMLSSEEKEVQDKWLEFIIKKSTEDKQEIA